MGCLLPSPSNDYTGGQGPFQHPLVEPLLLDEAFSSWFAAHLIDHDQIAAGVIEGRHDFVAESLGF